jgi:hypothetical protein
MKVFLSWSGEHSHSIAQAFNERLPTVIQSVKPRLSSEHISKGATWLEELRKALSESNGIGLFFLTREALRSEWLLFEAGGIAALDKQRVCTVCIDVPSGELTPPLNFFQATNLERQDVLNSLTTGLAAATLFEAPKVGVPGPANASIRPGREKKKK